MKISKNGVVRDMTEEEIAQYNAAQAEIEKEYWLNIPYEDAVNAEIRKKYSDSAEFAILRQKDEKLEEYARYYAYCEECKAYVKQKMKIFGGGDNPEHEEM